jgi:MFS family permease
LTQKLSLSAAPKSVVLLLAQLVARFPFGMLSLAFIIHIQDVTGSYAIAGIALGAETIGASIAGPILSRYMAIFGIRRVIAIATVITTTAFLSMAFVPPEPLLLVFISFVVGLSSPPIQPAARTIYPQITPKHLLRKLYSLDAAAQEIIWVLGPLVATLVAAQFGNVAMLLTIGGIQIFGSIWLLLNKSVKTAKIPLSKTAVGRVLKNPSVTAVTFLGLLFVGSFAGVEVGAVALFDKSIAGVMFAVFSLGSLLGGFVIAPRAKSKYSLIWFVGLSLIGYTALLFSPYDPIWVGSWLFIAGIGVAPTLGILALWVAEGTTGSETAEAYGWTTTGQLVGFSAGSALAGIAIDTASAPAALIVSVVFGVATLLASIYAVRELKR